MWDLTIRYLSEKTVSALVNNEIKKLRVFVLTKFLQKKNQPVWTDFFVTLKLLSSSFSLGAVSAVLLFLKPYPQRTCDADSGIGT